MNLVVCCRLKHRRLTTQLPSSMRVELLPISINQTAMWCQKCCYFCTHDAVSKSPPSRVESRSIDEPSLSGLIYVGCRSIFLGRDACVLYHGCLLLADSQEAETRRQGQNGLPQHTILRLGCVGWLSWSAPNRFAFFGWHD